MIDLNKIIIKNFMSFGNEPTEIDLRHENILVYGINGSSKSSVLESIHFALFGSPIRPIKKEELINIQNKNKCYVELYLTRFGKEIVIERGMKPNILKLTVDGEEKKEGVSKANFQKEIENIIGINKKIFRQIVLIDSQFYKPFLELNPYEKRNVIDDIFGLSELRMIQDKAKEYRSKIKSNIDENLYNIDLHTEKIKINEDFNNNEYEKQVNVINKKIDDNNNFIIKKESELDTIDGDIIKHQEDLISYQNELANLNKKIKPFSDEIVRLNHNILNIKKEIKNMESIDGESKCPRCKTIITEEHKNQELSRLSKDLKDYEVKINEQEKQKESYESKKIEIEGKEKEIQHELLTLNKSEHSLKNEIKNLKKHKKQLSKELKNIQEEHEKKNDNIEELREELKLLKKDKHKNIRIQELVNESIDMLNDGNIREYILRSYLKDLNKYITYYLTLFESNFSFKLNSSLEQDIDDRLRDVLKYNQLSNGQKARVNFAILFSLIKFSENKSNTKFSTIFLDEILEGNGLDSDGKEFILDTILHKLKKKVILISHDSTLKDKFKVNYKMIKKGTFSQIEVE
jgi:DNA repair exonuclease SbcCD ATPase subunit